MNTDLAWAAGFFEGEGTVYVPPPTQGRGLRLSVAQSSDDANPPLTLLRFMHAVGDVGKITALSPNKLSKRQRWIWRVQRRDISEGVLVMLRPHLTAEPNRNR